MWELKNKVDFAALNDVSKRPHKRARTHARTHTQPSPFTMTVGLMFTHSLKHSTTSSFYYIALARQHK